jgi:hypothetical protein
MAATSPPARRRIAIGGAVLAGVALVTGCITGERPTLAEGPVSTGDPAVDAVLARLEGATQSAFTADYDVLTRFGDLRSEATVVQDGPARRSITIGSIRFIVDGATSATCDLDAGQCQDSIQAGRVSDTQLTPDFYAVSAAARLRRDADLRMGPTTAATETVAGQPATCVAIPVNGGPTTYCALDSGPLARLDAADVVIEATTWSPDADQDAFDRPG